MINDIRFQASQLLQLQDNTAILETNHNTSVQDNNLFEELMQENIIEEQDKKNSNSFMPLGIPAGFNIDFSLLEEMEKSS